MSTRSEEGTVWPNFFIVGAAKAGTTSLYEHLSQHPNVYMSPVKEPHFFSQVMPSPAQRRMAPSITKLDEYQNLFKHAAGFDAVGEASPSYLWDAHCPERIATVVPHAKIIIILRDPIDRAYSHYLMDVREGVQCLSFHDALMADLLAPQKRWGWSHLYIELGMYHEQVKRYLAIFGKPNVMIVPFDDFSRDPNRVVGDAIAFLGLGSVESAPIDASARHNAYAAPRGRLAQRIMGNSWIRHSARSLVPKALRRAVRDRLLVKAQTKPEMDPRAVEYLAAIYEPNVLALEGLLQCSLSYLRGKWPSTGVTAVKSN